MTSFLLMFLPCDTQKNCDEIQRISAYRFGKSPDRSADGAIPISSQIHLTGSAALSALGTEPAENEMAFTNNSLTEERGAAWARRTTSMSSTLPQRSQMKW